MSGVSRCFVLLPVALVISIQTGCHTGAGTMTDGASGAGGGVGGASGAGVGAGGTGVGAGGTGVGVGDAGVDRSQIDANGSDERNAEGATDAAACFAACLQGVLDQCPRAGWTCVKSTSTTDISHYTTTSCYGNGVKRLETLNGTLDSVTVKKPNGDTCYQAAMDTVTLTEDFTDAAGNLIAHVQFGDASSNAVVTCPDGRTSNVDLSSADCANYVTSPPCTSGSCSF